MSIDAAAITDQPASRIVVCVNHYPLEVLPAGATRADARTRCDELDAAYKATKSIVGRYHHFHIAPEREVQL